MKRKNLIMSLAVVATMGMVLTGCGNKPEKVAVEVQETEEIQETQDDTVEEPTQEEEATEPTEEVEATTEDTDTVDLEIKEGDETVVDEQVEVGDYLSEHGITITPQGTMMMTLARNNSDELVDTTVVTSVVEEPAEEGYTNTIFRAEIDVASTDNNFNSAWHVYDRYTGYDLEGLAEQLVLVDESGSSTNKAIVEVDDKEYDCIVTVDADTDSDPNYWYVTITVHHPTEYDGVVFEAGKLTATMESVETTVDKSVVRKIADYPELIEGHYFFTASDK